MHGHTEIKFISPATIRLLTTHSSQGWQSDVGKQPLLSQIHLNQLHIIEFIHR